MLMKKHVFFVARLFVVAGALGGCGNDPTTGSTLVEGQAVAGPGSQPVAGAAVQVYQSGGGRGYGEVGDPVAADAQGRFSFRFDATSTSGYIVMASTPLGHRTNWGLAPKLTAGRKNTGLVIPMYAPAWVRFQLVDVPPQNRVSIFFSGYEGNGDRLNYPRDTAVIRPSLAGFAGKFTWVIRDEQGVDKQYYSQNVNMLALDTLTVRVPF
ncbi:MAG: hypothetical protein JWR44_2331 [Hymenobacter sp.]|nr:hypothetical protein [Hymenobacter sp.]